MIWTFVYDGKYTPWKALAFLSFIHNKSRTALEGLRLALLSKLLGFEMFDRRHKKKIFASLGHLVKLL